MAEKPNAPDDWPEWGLGSYVTPGKIKRTFWDSTRTKHDPEDKDSKDWDASEPDPEAP
jgi:hypothetical protein